MSGKFDIYIDESNKKLKDILLSGGVDEAVKNNLLHAFSEELSNSIFKESPKNIDLIFDETSLVYNDEYISQVLSQDKPGVAQINKAIDICEIQKNILKNSSANKSRIKNENIDVCLKKLLTLKNEISLEDNLKASEKKIDDLLDRARKSNSLKDYDFVLDALIQHENTINSAVQLKQAIPYTKYNDIKKIRKQITDEKYNLACKLLVENDNAIVMLIKNNTLISYDEALEKCSIQKNYLDIFDKNQWKKPKITYSDIASSTAVITSKKETLQAYIELKNLDDSLEKTIKSADESFDLEKCEKSKELLKDYEKKLSAFKAKKAEMPNLVNDDIRKTEDRINGIIAKIEDKNALHKKMDEVDSDISKAIQSFDDTAISCDKIADLLTGQKHLFDECSRKRFPLPTLKNKDIGGLVKKYSVYKDVILTDTDISKMDKDLSSKNKYDNYINKCKKLDSLLSECRRSNYGIPNIDNANPAALVKKAESEWNKTLIRYKIKKWLILSGIGAALILALVLFIYFSTRTSFPYSIEAMNSMNYMDIKNGLEESGYTNISCVPDDSGWEKSGTFREVYIDEQKGAEQGKLYKKNAAILIKYASMDRIDINTVLHNWKDESLETVLSKLGSAGFTNVDASLEEITYDFDKKTKVHEIKIAGVAYDNQTGFIPRDVQIIVKKYKLYCTTDKKNTDFIDKESNEVIKYLKDRGFENITSVFETSGIKAPGKVMDVIIDDSSAFLKDHYYPYDANITVKISSQNRIDLTDTLKDFNKQEYTLLEATLLNKGIKNVVLIEEPTFDASYDKKVKEIVLGSEKYNSGNCHIDKNTKITITYYSLYYKLNASSYQLATQDVYSLQTLLKNTGFAEDNITVKEIYTGLKKAGTILSISVGEKTSFTADDIFKPDSKIVITISSWGRLDLQKILNNIDWRNVSYTYLEDRLKENKYTDISVVSYENKDCPDIGNNSVRSIMINGEIYNGGECFVATNVPIVITYNISLISPGVSADAFSDHSKADVIAYMERRGFKYNSSADDNKYYWTSLGHTTGTVKDILINGSSDFKLDDYFTNGTEFSLLYWG